MKDAAIKAKDAVTLTLEPYPAHFKPCILTSSILLLGFIIFSGENTCLLYTSDAADDTPCVDLGGRRIIKNSYKRRVNTLSY